MAFYNSGIRRMLEGKIGRSASQNAREIRVLKANEKADDTSRSGIQGIVAGHTTQIANQISAYPIAEGIQKASFDINYNDAFYDNGSVHSMDTGVEVAANRIIEPISITVYIYDTEGVGQNPTFNTGTIPHKIFFTRHKDTAISGANASYMIDGTMSINIGAANDLVQGAGFLGPKLEKSSYMPPASKRSMDHLNMQKSNGDIDSNIWAIFTRGNPTENTTTGGENTKMRIVLQYRLTPRPTLT